MTLGCLATYGQEDGWTFAITVLDLSLTELLASTLGDQDKAKQLPEVTFPELELKVTPQTGAFSFRGVAEIHWKNPLGRDGEFDCKIDLKLERTAAENSLAATPAVTCDIEITGSGLLKINDKDLKAQLEVRAKNPRNDEFTAGGSLATSCSPKANSHSG